MMDNILCLTSTGNYPHIRKACNYCLSVGMNIMKFYGFLGVSLSHGLYMDFSWSLKMLSRVSAVSVNYSGYI